MVLGTTAATGKADTAVENNKVSEPAVVLLDIVV